MAEFDGFARPTSNYYRLPNNWFDLWRQTRQVLATGERPARIIAPLKVTEYVIKWGRVSAPLGAVGATGG